MREIKFRAWIDDEELCNEEEILHHLDENENFIPFMQDLDSWYFDDEQTLGDYFDYFDKEKIMQYTGLNDKNGKEIYEGDFVKIKDSCTGMEFIGVVDFMDASFMIKTDYSTNYRWMDYDVEVIENVYENQELLR